MAQDDMVVAAGNGSAVRAKINSALAAAASTQKGPNAPTSPVAGMQWIEDDNPSATVWSLRCYDGVAWINLGQIDTSNDRFVPSGLFLAGSAATPGFAPSGDSDTGMWSPGANLLAFSTNGAERLRINSAGFVGIGTTSPTDLAHVARNDGNPVGFRADNLNASGGYPRVLLYDVRGAANVRKVLVRNDGGLFNIGTLDDAETTYTRWLTAYQGNFMLGTTANDGSATGFSVTTGYGGETVARFTGASGPRAHLTFHKAGSTATIGSIICGDASVSFNTTSDARLKTPAPDVETDIEAIAEALRPEMIRRLDAPDMPPHLAFLAQRVAFALPEAVTRGSDAGPGQDGFRAWQMDYAQTTPAIMALVHHLLDRVAALEARVGAGG